MERKEGKGETRIEDSLKWMLSLNVITMKNTLSTIYSFIYCTQDTYVLHCIKWSMFPGGCAMRIKGGYAHVWSMFEVIRSRKERLYWSVSLTSSKAFHPLWPHYLLREEDLLLVLSVRRDDRYKICESHFRRLVSGSFHRKSAHRGLTIIQTKERILPRLVRTISSNLRLIKCIFLE